jgi:hypothetical protein
MISMGLGAWLGSSLDTNKYEVERARELKEVAEVPEREEQEIRQIMSKYRVRNDIVEAMIGGFRKDHDAWVDVSKTVACFLALKVLTLRNSS